MLGELPTLRLSEALTTGTTSDVGCGLEPDSA